MQIVHCLPGRMRVRLPRLKGNASLAGDVERTLTALEGIQHVATSTTTGSVLILYAPHALTSLDSRATSALRALAGLLGLAVEQVDTNALWSWFQTGANGTDAEPPTACGDRLTACFTQLNAGMTQKTGGWGELRTLVPLMLACLGLRSLLFTDNLPFPTWYDYLWFAFSTFMILHAPGVTRKQGELLESPVVE
jgi:hypothetical protein